MSKGSKIGLFSFLVFGLSLIMISMAQMGNLKKGDEKEIKLPQPNYKGKISVEEAIFNRKSVRYYKDEPLTLKDVSQLLWAAGGITVDGVTGPTRSYASAGGSYPLEIYLVVGKVKELSPGLYHYLYRDHKIVKILEGDLRQDLNAFQGQGIIPRAPISIIFTASYPRTTGTYRKKGERFVHMDLGHAGQNVHLQAEALGLGTVVIGAFNEEGIKKILKLKDEEPLYIMPVGKKIK